MLQQLTAQSGNGNWLGIHVFKCYLQHLPRKQQKEEGRLQLHGQNKKYPWTQKTA